MNINESNIIKSNSEYQNETFINLDIKDKGFEASEFIDCVFSSSNLSERTFSKCSFDNCVFKNCNFSLTKFLNTNFHNCKFIASKFVGVDWTIIKSTLDLSFYFEKCDLSYSNFQQMKIGNSIFKSCKLHEVDFTDVNLKNSSFKNSDLLRSKFLNTNLHKVNFLQARNYLFDLRKNFCVDAKFDYPEVMNLLNVFGIKVLEDSDN